MSWYNLTRRVLETALLLGGGIQMIVGEYDIATLTIVIALYVHVTHEQAER